jgi:sugar phosphate permease
MLVAFPAGRMVDRFNPRPLILAGLLVLGTFLMAASLAESVPLMLALLALAGTGQGLSSPALTTAASLWVSPVIRGTAMGIKQSGVPGGAALSAAILPTVALMTTWRFSLLATGLAIIAAGLVTDWLLRHYVQRDRTDKPKTDSAHTLRAHVWRKDILLIIGSQVCLLFAQFAFVAYFVLYLTETLLFTVVAAGLCLSLAQAIAWVGRIGWGVLSDRVLGGNRRISYAIMALLAAAFMFLISLTSIDTPVWVVVCVSIAFGLSGLSWAPTFLNCVTEMAGPAMAGTAVGLGVSIGYTVNIAGVPFLGYLADWTGTYRATWQFAAACALVGFILIVLAGQCKEDYSWGSVA